MKCQHKANNNREAVVVCAMHVVKRPSKRMRASAHIYLYTSVLRLLVRFTTCLVQTTTVFRLLFISTRHFLIRKIE